MTDGFRSLRDGEPVEFVVETSDDGRQKVGRSPPACLAAWLPTCHGAAGGGPAARWDTVQAAVSPAPHPTPHHPTPPSAPQAVNVTGPNGAPPEGAPRESYGGGEYGSFGGGRGGGRRGGRGGGGYGGGGYGGNY